MTEFNSVLLEISDDLRDNNLDRMKFLYSKLGKRCLEKIDSGIKLFQELMQRNELGPDNTERLKKYLKEIHREDLVEKLNNFEAQCPAAQTDLPNKTEQAKLNAATTVIERQLGQRGHQGVVFPRQHVDLQRVTGQDCPHVGHQPGG